MEVSGLTLTCVLMFAGAYGCGMLPRLLPGVCGARLGAVSAGGRFIGWSTPMQRS